MGKLIKKILNKKIIPRSKEDAHRAATPLELFFDLVFVVAIASAASNFHHGVIENHIFDSVLKYAMIFFGIWWAWMGFTWFASAYDNDRTTDRLLVFAQMTGALIISAGVTPFFKTFDNTILVIGYIVLRAPLVLQWFRVARHDPIRRITALRYAWGITLAQIMWILLLFIPGDNLLFLFIPAILVELAIPVWAERAEQTPWHESHIKERYGLFTIIVLGESILAASLAIEAVTSFQLYFVDLLIVIVGGLLILYSSWWIYFNQPDGKHLSAFNKSANMGFLWGYGHLPIFASAAAIGAGIAILIDHVTHHGHITTLIANLFVTVPVAIFLISLWFIHYIPQKNKRYFRGLFIPSMSLLIVATSFFKYSILITGILMVAIIVTYMLRYRMLRN